MKRKFNILSVCSLVLSLAIFVFSYLLYHYATAAGTFSSVWHAQPEKPLVTVLFAVWGVMFLFAGVMSLLISHIFFSDKQ